MIWKELTAPPTTPVTLDEAKAHMRVTEVAEDALIVATIEAATQIVEARTNRALITRTFRLYGDRWPKNNVIEIPLSPASAVTEIRYKDASNVSTVFPTSSYATDFESEPGRIVLASGSYWPTAYAAPNAVELDFTAGYGLTGSDVPAGLRAAVLLYIAHLFENREPVNIGNIVTPIDLLFDYVIGPYRVVSLA